MTADNNFLPRWIFEGGDLPKNFTSFAGFDAISKAIFLVRLFDSTQNSIVYVVSEKSEGRLAAENISYLMGTKSRVHYIPASDMDYFRGIFPDAENVHERNCALYYAGQSNYRAIFIVGVEALTQKVFSKQVFAQNTIKLAANLEWDRDQLALKLIELGYRRTAVAEDCGTFSVRGGVLDVFSPLYEKPIRIEFYGDLLESVRFFEPDTQRSLDPIESAHVIINGLSLVPSGELFEKAALEIKHELDEQGVPKKAREDAIAACREGQLSGQLSFLFPYLSGGSASLWEYFSANATWVIDGKERLSELASEMHIPRLRDQHELFVSHGEPIAAANKLISETEEVLRVLNKTEAYSFDTFASADASALLSCEAISLGAEREQAKKSTGSGLSLDGFAERFKSWMSEGDRIHIICHTQTHIDRIKALFEPYGLKLSVQDAHASFMEQLRISQPLQINLWRGNLSASGRYPQLSTVIITEAEIFGERKRSAKKQSNLSAVKIMNSFRDLNIGDFIVHRDHGIGKYLGLKSMTFQEIEGDYVLLEYRDGDKLYIPVYRLSLIQKYVGGEHSSPVLDKLGGERWTKARQKAEQAAQSLAAEFLRIQAKRKTIPGPKFTLHETEYQQFEMSFPFEETPDQQRAIDEVRADLLRPYPMDRLVVGDVGYGKTEVAMRAAFQAVLSGFQVAILVPTTVLAHQHFTTFRARFAPFGVQIEMLSRLRSAAENKKTVDKAKTGHVDILVGTHRILSSDVQFNKLGLVVVDEEHRFGVAHKEKLKRFCDTVHILSMSATPIPRTLNMAMTGIKDISMIVTPPPDRLAIRTFVCRHGEEVVGEAISNELARSGQVFYLHNRIESISKVSEMLRDIFPKLKIEVVHGQMDPKTLEGKMLAFYQHEFDVLLTTAIIESGIDIPRVNTIIIDRAHQLGLAQLYQLRGRVGRSNQRAYCYLLTPSEKELTPDAKERLQVIQRHTDLGSGFNIASHDLEIRGAGDLLGKDQSGHLSAVGVDMYFDLLEDSIRYLRGEGVKNQIEPEINLRVPAFFPSDYLPDVGERVAVYRKMSDVEDEDQLSQIEEEVRDRFGEPPTEVINLLGLMRIKLYLRQLHVTHLNCGPKKASLQFASSTPVTPEKMVQVIQKSKGKFSMTPDQKLVFEVDQTDWRSMLHSVQTICVELGA